MKRRNLIQAFLVIFLPNTSALTCEVPVKKIPKYRRVQWQKLHDEKIGPGDFLVRGGDDPNTPECQDGRGFYNLIMQAAFHSNYGVQAKTISCPYGEYWRPVGVVEV
jgi:hypothetical protein